MGLTSTWTNPAAIKIMLTIGFFTFLYYCNYKCYNNVTMMSRQGHGGMGPSHEDKNGISEVVAEC